MKVLKNILANNVPNATSPTNQNKQTVTTGEANTFLVKINFVIPDKSPETQQLIKNQFKTDLEDYNDWKYMFSDLQNQFKGSPMMANYQDGEPTDNIGPEIPQEQNYLKCQAACMSGPIKIGPYQLIYPFTITSFDIGAKRFEKTDRNFVQNKKDDMQACIEEIKRDAKRLIQDWNPQYPYKLQIQVFSQSKFLSDQTYDVVEPHIPKPMKNDDSVNPKAGAIGQQNPIAEQMNQGHQELQEPK